jgi:hypothetical protein
VIAGAAAILLLTLMTSTLAGPTPSGYHWARQRSHFTLEVGDNVSSGWNRLLKQAVDAWNANDTVTFRLVTGGTNGQRCNATTGRVEVCSGFYGTQQGWLGLTRLYFDNKANHVDAVTVQMNDSYFTQKHGEYNSDAARQHTMCHELGHAPGLDHVDSDSCMNDSQNAVFHNLTPIKKDFRKLRRIYKHQDSYTTVEGRQQRGRARSESFFAPTALPAVPSGLDSVETEIVQPLANGGQVVTFITWAQD